MATSTERLLDRTVLLERWPVAAGSLFVAAGLAFGATGVATGATPGLEHRLPVYALCGAFAFLGALLGMRASPRDAAAVLRRASLAGLAGLAIVGLGTEAVVYGLVLLSGLALYVSAAVVVSFGVLYWSVRTWHTVEDLTRPW